MYFSQTGHTLASLHLLIRSKYPCTLKEMDEFRDQCEKLKSPNLIDNSKIENSSSKIVGSKKRKRWSTLQSTEGNS
jgi:hypothetical protein